MRLLFFFFIMPTFFVDFCQLDSIPKGYIYLDIVSRKIISINRKYPKMNKFTKYANYKPIAISLSPPHNRAVLDYYSYHLFSKWIIM